MSEAESGKNQSRRDFMKALGIGAALAVPATSALLGVKARAQGAAPALTMVKESDSNAQALGYKEDATKVDVKKISQARRGCWQNPVL